MLLYDFPCILPYVMTVVQCNEVSHKTALAVEV